MTRHRRRRPGDPRTDRDEAHTPGRSAGSTTARSSPDSPAPRRMHSRSSPSSRTISRSTTATWNARRWSLHANGAPTSTSASSKPCWPSSNGTTSLIISGSGEIIEPDDGIVAIGSGGSFALAAARMLVKHSSLGAREIVEESLRDRRRYLHLHQHQYRHRRTVTRAVPGTHDNIRCTTIRTHPP